MTTQQLLDVLRDARDQGLWQEQAAIVEEIGADVEYRGCSYRCSPDQRDDVLGKREIVAKLEWMLVSSWWDDTHRRFGLLHTIRDDHLTPLYAERDRMRQHASEQFGVSRQQFYATVTLGD